jgi:acyl-homoserine-lactone acylase
VTTTTSIGVGDQGYEAEIRWTTHDVPHIRAGDLGGLGFGQGYACAGHHLPTIADQILKVRSERSRFFGRGDADAHVNSDFGYLALGIREHGRQMAQAQTDDINQTVAGYAAGLNHWLEQNGTGALPAWCRDAAWVRPISPDDLFALYADLAIIASGRNLAGFIGSAQPPGGDASPSSEPLSDGGLGSNGWALGAEATANGRGMVMANPHFPWGGEARFWECHLQIPGDIDVYGAALLGTPGVQIGVNKHVAWTHTFSRGHRFTVYKLDLADDRPTTYRYGDDERELTSTSYEIGVGTDEESTEFVSRTLWSSHYGPMVDLPFLGWSDTNAFTYRDANLGNDRFLPVVADLDRSGNVAEARQALADNGGLLWVNTMVADDTGRCFYIDSSPTPNLTSEAQQVWADATDDDPITALLYANRVALLDGSDPAFEWQDVDGAPRPGLVPFDQLPQVERDDHVFNSNDPYWLAHATEHLDEHSAFHGLFKRPVSPRTRMNATLLNGAGPVTPTGDGGTFTPDDIEAAVFGNHSLVAIELLEGVVERCQAAGSADAGGRTIDLSDACRILSAWDGRFELDSVGAVLWREFLASFPEEAVRNGGPLYETDWDPDAPITTPTGLTSAPDGKAGTGGDPLAIGLAAAVAALEQAGLTIDTPLGEAQFVERGGERIPLHGANEIEGIANVVAPLGALARSDLEPAADELPAIPGRTERTGLRVGGYPIIYGASFVMTAWFEDDGPRARGLLAYGQSGDPESEHHVNQVRAFSQKEFRDFLLTDDQINSDPDLRTETIRSTTTP